jgi:hypothetical protein
MGVELHIEELVLDGFAPGDRHRIAEAIRDELSRLIGSAGGVKSLANRPSLERIDGGSFEIKAGGKPQAAGKQIARAVFRSLRQQATPASSQVPGQSITGGSRS